MIEHVYAYRDDRLGTALLNLAHAWWFAERVGARLTCVWPSRHPERGHMPFTELFEWPQDGAEFEYFDGLNRRVFEAVNLRPFWGQDDFSVDVLPPETSAVYYPFAGPLMVRGETRASAVAHARQFIRSLRLHPSIRAARDRVRCQLNLEEAVSIHLRRGDVVSAVLDTNASPEKRASSIGTFVARYADVSAYARALAATHPKSDVILFSDDPESVGQMCRALPQSRVSDMSEFEDIIGELTVLQRAFLEILLMSDTRAVYASKSNFSGFAAFYGDTRLLDVRRWLDLRSMDKELRERFGQLSDAEVVISDILGRFEAMIARVPYFS